MQSTGQTSTHERSLVLMHGSAIMYVIQHLHCQWTNVSYEYPGRDVAVDIETDEFTAVCPWSGLPDFGTVKIRYLPGGKILELRSLKYYLLSYRNVGIYQEHAVTRMLDDLVTTVEPKWMEISLDYKIRGGIHTVCRVRYPHLENA